MKIPEIERDLKGHVPVRLIYHMQRMQEEIIACEQAIKGCAKVIAGMAEVLEKVNVVNTTLNQRWNRQLGRDQSASDIVSSVLERPDEE